MSIGAKFCFVHVCVCVGVGVGVGVGVCALPCESLLISRSLVAGVKLCGSEPLADLFQQFTFFQTSPSSLSPLYGPCDQQGVNKRESIRHPSLGTCQAFSVSCLYCMQTDTYLQIPLTSPSL